MNARYYIKTFGCQMNVRDSETAAGVLQRMGYQPAEDMQQADVVLFNTCCIRELAERKAVSAIGAARALQEEKRNLIIGVFGCMTQQDGAAADIMARFPFVNFVTGTNNIHALPAMIHDARQGKRTQLSEIGRAADDFDLPAYHNKPPLAFVNIVFGCNNFCTYCIVPYVRGRESSRPRQLILDEIKQLADKGYSEVTLLGQNVNSYGKGIGDSFANLLREADKTGIQRIRFMTSHPKDLSQDMIDAMAECPSVCAQIHLPVQSGSDAVLKAMNRKYDVQKYYGLVEALRKAMPDVGITSDIIAGFPGETEKDFRGTLQLLRDVRLDAAYTFAFSPRAGTKAADMPGQLDNETKQRRLKELIDLQAGITMQLHKQLVGRTEDVLAEGFSRKDMKHLTGRAERGRKVNFAGKRELVGQLVPVRITRANKNTLFGVQEG